MRRWASPINQPQPKEGKRVKKTIFLALMCFSLSVFAYDLADIDVNMSAAPDSDCMAGCSSEVISNTEISDSTPVTGGNTQHMTAGFTKTVFKPSNDEIKPLQLVKILPYEVGWQS